MSGSALIFKLFFISKQNKTTKNCRNVRHAERSYTRKIEYYALGRHPRNQGIMLKIMLGWRYNAQIMPD